MMDQGVSFSVSPAASPHTPYSTFMQVIANDLETLLETNYQLLHYDAAIELSLWDAAAVGSGILKTVWDGGLEGGLGNANIVRVDPWSFYPDPNATSMDDSQYFIEYRRMSVDEIMRRFPLAYDQVMRNISSLRDGGNGPADETRPFVYDNSRYPMANPSALPGGTFQNPSGKGGMGSYGLPGQARQSTSMATMGVNVYECWVRENIVDPPMTDDDPNSALSQDAPNIYSQWRVIVHAAGVVLMDEIAPDLWSYDRHPYDRVIFDDIGEFWGLCLTTHLTGGQIAINRLLASVQQNAELTGNPILLNPPELRHCPTGDDFPTRREVYSPSSSAVNGNAKPEWMQPPQVPQYIIELINWWIGRLENTSGISPITKGQMPQGRNSGQTVTSVQDSAFVRIRSGLRHLERTLGNVGNLLAQLIIENFTVPRTVAIVGPQGAKSALHLAAKHFYAPYRDTDGNKQMPLKYALIVTAGANNPTSRQARITEADTLFAMGAIDQQAVLEAHGYPNWQVIVQRVMQQQQQLAAAGQQAKPPGARQRSKRKT